MLCYKCESCGNKTREIGNNSNDRICAQCYSISVIENLIADGIYENNAELQDLEQHIKDLEAEIVKRKEKSDKLCNKLNSKL